MTKKKKVKTVSKQVPADVVENKAEKCECGCGCDKDACTCGCGCKCCNAKAAVLAGTALAVVLSVVACVKTCCLDSRIANWVESHPEVIARMASPVAVAATKIAADPTNYSLGNPNGKFVIIEFFDYNCGWCQRTNAAMKEALARPEAKNIRWIPIDTPIFGASSETIARYVLAAGKQGKYKQMHDAVATGNPKLSEARGKAAKLVDEFVAKNKLDRESKDRAVQEKIHDYANEASVTEYSNAMKEIGKALGLDTAELERVANSEEISKKLFDNQAFTRTLEAGGVPMLIVNGEKHGGALFGEELDKVVAESAK